MPRRAASAATARRLEEEEEEEEEEEIEEIVDLDEEEGAPKGRGKRAASRVTKKKGKKGQQKLSSGPFTLMHRIREDHGKELFAIAVNHTNPSFRNLFAVCGSNRVTVYELDEANTNVLQTYADENKEENFYALAWSYFPDQGTPLIACGGARGIIRVIDVIRKNVYRVLTGHGNHINDLKFHPSDPNLLLSASKDESLRYWNIRTNVCIAVFCGDKGHRGEVLNADFHLDGMKMASCGMDNTIKIWNLASCATALDESYEHDAPPSGAFECKHIKTAIVQHPIFSTSCVHANYVDCIRWYGDLLLTKSTYNKVVLWRDDATPPRQADAVSVYQEYPYTCSDIWFVRFDVDPQFKMLAVGNQEGRVYVWDLTDLRVRQIANLAHPQCRVTVRQTAFSHDGKTLLCVCDDSSLWRWEYTE